MYILQRITLLTIIFLLITTDLHSFMIFCSACVCYSGLDILVLHIDAILLYIMYLHTFAQRL